MAATQSMDFGQSDSDGLIELSDSPVNRTGENGDDGVLLGTSQGAASLS